MAQSLPSSVDQYNRRAETILFQFPGDVKIELSIPIAAVDQRASLNEIYSGVPQQGDLLQRKIGQYRAVAQGFGIEGKVPDEAITAFVEEASKNGRGFGDDFFLEQVDEQYGFIKTGEYEYITKLMTQTNHLYVPMPGIDPTAEYTEYRLENFFGANRFVDIGVKLTYAFLFWLARHYIPEARTPRRRTGVDPNHPTAVLAQQPSIIGNIRGAFYAKSGNVVSIHRQMAGQDGGRAAAQPNIAEYTRRDTCSGGAPFGYTSAQQNLVRYFKPELPIKGMLVHWSVGSGKTCLAHAIASINFEPEQYMILYVTRLSLRTSAYKSAFDPKVKCNLSTLDANVPLDQFAVQNEYMKKNTNWLGAMSYHEFSNYCSSNYSTRHNEFSQAYDRARIPGHVEGLKKDPLYRMLIIFDEAHILYNKEQHGADNRAVNPEAVEQAAFMSYKVSGINSCRWLLMTGSPLVTHPLHLIKLLNLLEEFEIRRINIKNEGEFDAKYFPPGSPESTKFIQNEIMNKLLTLVIGRVSYLSVTGIAPVFPQFSKIQVMYVPASRVQISEAVTECSKKGVGTIETARCLRRRDLISSQLESLSVNVVKAMNPQDRIKLQRNIMFLSPKYHALAMYLKKQKEMDIATYGVTFKRVVYVDFTRESVINSLITILLAFGFRFTSVISNGSVRFDTPISIADLRTRDIPYYALPIGKDTAKFGNVDIPTQILKQFNKHSTYTADNTGIREEGNEYGQYASVLILPSQYKEGIDIFDCVEFINLSPSISVYTDVQALGRVQRHCGNRWLEKRVAFDQLRPGKAPPLVYTELRSYLPASMIKPSARESKVKAIIDEFNAFDYSSGFKVDDLFDAKSRYVALNKITDYKGEHKLPFPGTSDNSGVYFTGSQYEYLRQLFAFINNEGYYSTAGKRAHVTPEILRHIHDAYAKDGIGAGPPVDGPDFATRRSAHIDRIFANLMTPSAYATQVGIDLKRLQGAFFQPFYVVSPTAVNPTTTTVRTGMTLGESKPLRAVSRRPAAATANNPAAVQMKILTSIQADQKAIDQFVTLFDVKPTQWTLDKLYEDTFKRSRSYDAINSILLTILANFSIDSNTNVGVNDTHISPTSIIEHLTKTTGTVLSVSYNAAGGASYKPEARVRPAIPIAPEFARDSQKALVIPDMSTQFSEDFAVTEVVEAKREREQARKRYDRERKSQDKGD